MSGLKLLQQLLLPGVRSAKGAQRIAGKPGYYVVEPSLGDELMFREVPVK